MSRALPVGWLMSSVAQVAQYVRGVTYIKAHATNDARDGFVPVLRANNIGEGLNFDGLVYVPDRFVSDEQLVRDGDVVIAMSSGSKKIVGKAARATNPRRCGFGAFCGLIRPSSQIQNAFLGYYFQTQAYRNAVSEVSKGVNINNLKAGHVLSQPLPVPPRAEQARIASKIDELFSRIDEGERALARVQKLVERYRQSVLKAAVTGELTRDWRAQHKGKSGHSIESGEALLHRILAARRAAWEQSELAKLRAKGITPKDDAWKKKYNEPASPDTTGLPALPEGWVWVSVEQLVGEFGNGLSRKPAGEPPGLPILRISAVRPLAVDATDVRYYVPESGESLAAFEVRHGDLLFTRYNGSKALVGVSGVYRGEDPILHPDKLIKVRVAAPNLIAPVFLAIACNAGASWAHISDWVKTSAGQHGVAGSDIKRTPVPLPPTSEQSEIVNRVEGMQEQCALALAGLRAEIRRSNSLRQSVLRAAFSGGLVPQDPADEPASALLARIAAERVAPKPAAPQRGRKKKTA